MWMAVFWGLRAMHAGIEGLIHDHAGKCSKTIMTAELRALQSDLELALSMECTHLEVNSK